MATPEQCRAARGLLGWSQAELSRNSAVSEGTIKNFESGKHSPQKSSRTLIEQTLEKAGIEFIGNKGVNKK